MRKIIISVILVLCMIFSTVSVFAVVPSTIHMITIDGQTYNFVVFETEMERDVRVYDVEGVLVEHMQYNKETDVMYDVLRNERHEMQLSMNLLNHEVGEIDAEGYYFMGNYVADLGKIKSILSISTICIAYGTTVATANSIVTAARIAIESQYNNWVLTYNMIGVTINEYLELVGPTIEARGELWMKTDDTYDYSKKIETFYYVAVSADMYLFGPVTTRQQKRNDV